MRRLLRRLQRRRQDDRRLDLYRRRGGVRRRDLYRHARALAVEGRAARLACVGMPTDADTHRGHKYFITADIVVLAAGTLGSTEILLRSRRRGCALSDWLGSRFTSNGDAIALAYNNDVPVNGIGVGQPPKAQVPPVGQAVNALIDLRDTKDVRDGLAMCECALPSAFASALPALLAPGARCLRRAREALARRSARSDGARHRQPDQGRLSGRRAQHADLPRRRPRRRQRADAPARTTASPSSGATVRNSASSSASRKR